MGNSTEGKEWDIASIIFYWKHLFYITSNQKWNPNIVIRWKLADYYSAIKTRILHTDWAAEMVKWKTVSKKIASILLSENLFKIWVTIYTPLCTIYIISYQEKSLKIFCLKRNIIQFCVLPRILILCHLTVDSLRLRLNLVMWTRGELNLKIHLQVIFPPLPSLWINETIKSRTSSMV